MEQLLEVKMSLDNTILLENLLYKELNYLDDFIDTEHTPGEKSIKERKNEASKIINILINSRHYNPDNPQ